MRLLLCTGDGALDEFVRNKFGDQVVGAMYFREAIKEGCLRYSPDTMLISAALQGSVDIRTVVFEARMLNIRVVCLLDAEATTNGLGHDLMAMGVYDLLFSPVDAENIVSRLRHPASFADAASVLKPKANMSGGLLRNLLLSGSEEGKDGKGKENERPRDRVRCLGGEQKLVEAIISAGSDKAERKRTNHDSTGPASALNSFKPALPIIPVWSPAPCGKTFVAVNLAWVLSEAGPCVLVDLDRKQSVRNWLLLPEGEDSVIVALRRAKFGEPPPEPARVGNLKVYCADNQVEGFEVSREALARFLTSDSLGRGPVVIDMPSEAKEMDAWGGALLKAAGICVFVVDSDWAHVMAARKAFETLVKAEIHPIPVLNNYVDIKGVPGWSRESVLGVKPVAVLESRPDIVQESIITGRPAVMKEGDWRKVFRELGVRALEGFWRIHGDCDVGSARTASY
ncbi:MAG: hypothetical protein ACPLRM_10250 [Anaerolineae bacterium]